MRQKYNRQTSSKESSAVFYDTFPKRSMLPTNITYYLLSCSLTSSACMAWWAPHRVSRLCYTRPSSQSVRRTNDVFENCEVIIFSLLST